MEETQVEQRNDMENTDENSEMIWKIWKKRVIRYGQYGKKAS